MHQLVAVAHRGRHPHDLVPNLFRAQETDLLPRAPPMLCSPAAVPLLLCLCPFMHILVLLACYTHPVNNCSELSRLGVNGSWVPAAGVAAAKLRVCCIAHRNTAAVLLYRSIKAGIIHVLSASKQAIVCVDVKMQIAMSGRRRETAPPPPGNML